MTAQQKSPVRIGKTEETILFTLGRFVCLTAPMLTSYAFSPASQRFVQKRLNQLRDAGLVATYLGFSRFGHPPQVWFPTKDGWFFIEEAFSLTRPKRWRMDELRPTSYTRFLHDLGVAQIGMATYRLADQSRGTIRVDRFLHDRVMPQFAVKLPDGTRMDAKPDAFVDLRLRTGASLTEPGKPWMQVAHFWEFDRGSEERVAFRKRIKSRLLCVEREAYREHFPDIPTPMYLYLTEDQERQQQISKWCQAELTDSGKKAFANLFRFASCDLATIQPTRLYFTPMWTVPFQDAPVPLLRPLADPQREIVDLTVFNGMDDPYGDKEWLLSFYTRDGGELPGSRRERGRAEGE